MKTIKQMTLKEKLGQLIIAGFDGYEYNEHLKILIEEYKVANIILFTRNIKDIPQLIKLNKKIHSEVIKHTNSMPFISIDQEGGMVTRILGGATFCPGNMTLTATNDSLNAYKIGKIMGEELVRLGINMNLAPSLDVNNNPANPVIGVRSYSDNPNVVSEYGNQFIKGIQEKGIIATAKHFPGHGDTNVDSHLGLPVIKHDLKQLEKVELIPFKSAIQNGVKAIMSAHIVFEQIEKSGVPGTLSSTILTDLLRNEYHFKGLIVSDCMQMKAIDVKYTTEIGTVMGIKAGLDLACISHSLEKQIGAIKELEKDILNGDIPEALINEKVTRILQFKEEAYQTFRDNFINVDAKKLEEHFINNPNNQIASQLVDKSFTLLRGKPYLEKGKTLVIAASPFAATIAEDKLDSRSIIDMIRFEIPRFDVIKMDLKADNYDDIFEKARMYDQVVVCSYNCSNFVLQEKLIKNLNKISNELYIISTRNPYDFMVLENIQNICCVYEYTSNSVSTIVRFLKGELKANGKFPINYQKELGVSASLYVGLDDYSLSDNLKYLTTLKEHGIESVFISAHMPEMNANFNYELKEIVKKAKELELKIILDINKSRLSEMEDQGLLNDIYALRLDYGFTKEDMLSMLNRPYYLELNASAIKNETLEYLRSYGADLSKMRISHNFFPKPYTGLSYESVANKNKYLHELGLKVIIYIPSQNQKRPPLYEGLPTIEEHRNANIYSVLSEALLVGADEVCFGDAFASIEELCIANDFLNENSVDCIIVPIIVKKGLDNTQKDQLNKLHHNRLDASEYMVRSSVRASNIQIFNAVKRQCKDITIDNSLFKRYQGEVGIILKDIEADERVNVVGRCLCSNYLLDNIKPGQAFKFIIVGEE